MSEWNPRYVAYASAHTRTPDAMLMFDRHRCPGGCMAEFMVWMSEQWRDFEREHVVPYERLADRPLFRLQNADAFDVWLQARHVTKGNL